MKVLILNQIPEVNNKYNFSLCRSLIAHGVDVVTCCISDDDVSAYSDVPMDNFFAPYSKERGPVNKIISYRSSWERVIRYCSVNHVDIVHIQWCTFSPLDCYYHNKLQRMGIKVVVTIHDLLPFNKKFYDPFFHKLIYRHADVVISQAKANQQELTDIFGVDPGKTVYIPHGHYMDYAEPATQQESREKLNLPSNRPIILLFGQIKKVKGIDVLLEALPAVIQKHPDALCLIAGKVWKDDFSVYQKMIDEGNLSNHVRTDIRFIPDEDIKYYFNAADIVVLPYRHIYQSGVVLLAYAYEKPVVATTIGEFLTVIKPDQTGLLVEPGNAPALSDALIWLLEHPEKAKEFGILGKQDLFVRLSWTTIASAIVEEYRKVLGH